MTDMTTPALLAIGNMLRQTGARSSFAARRTAPDSDLLVEVKGVGRLRFPISRTAAQRLCRAARPARFGRGERTLYDRQVRDTFEIPKSRIKIDQRRWRRTLAPVLESIRSDLGLPEATRLEAELHSLLIYGPGQFFLRHQDSEKADEMVGTLVVTLPSPFTGGAIVVEHQGKSVTYRASKALLSFVAFYADCRHEVRPVRSGYRIALTYDLMLGAAKAGGTFEPPPEQVDTLAACLREHFATPLPPRPYMTRDAAPRQPPDRLVYLLDHQYTERSLGWSHLKGTDAARAALLRTAAQRAGCEIVLSLAEVHETWDCLEEEDWLYRSHSHRVWRRGGDDDDNGWEEDEDCDDETSADGFPLGDLLSSDITLQRWIEPSGRATAALLADVAGEEVCFATPSSALKPFESEYEGYMGNYGNTMDRWYRRAALVLWPAARAFTVRAKASPAWGLETLRQRIRSGGAAEGREVAAMLLPFWKTAARTQQQRGLFQKALRVAASLDAPELAAALLEPFWSGALTPTLAPQLVALAQGYGKAWMDGVLGGWFGSSDGGGYPTEGGSLAWTATAPLLCAALRAADQTAGTLVAQQLLGHGLRELAREIQEASELAQPSLRDRALAALAGPILAWLEAAAVVGAAALRGQAMALFCSNSALLGSLMQMLRLAAARAEPPSGFALGAIQQHCSREMKARLGRPARGENDWSIVLPEGCGCELCTELRVFLADPRQRRFEWPLAKERRQHVHIRLDTHELPVRHQTRRVGRPFTLVLEKSAALFEREAAERRALRRDLEWLAALPRGGARSRAQSRRPAAKRAQK